MDNFSTEEQVDASANGQGGNNNQYVVDGLDVTSGIRQGVLNLTPQPEAIRETSIQVNTFTSEYSRAAGLQTMFTTKSGTDQFHGSASDYFNYQKMYASQHFVGFPYLPFHSNNMDFAMGGPVIPHHNFILLFCSGAVAVIGELRRIGELRGSPVHPICAKRTMRWRRRLAPDC